MLLYRYFGSHAYETCHDQMLKVSKLCDFNDPFEGLYYYPESIDIKEARTAAEKQKKRDQNLLLPPNLAGKTIPELTRFIRNNYPNIRANLQRTTDTFQKLLRVVSLTGNQTTPADDIVMWSHYAMNHTGVRLGFSFPKSKRFTIKPVEYKSERIRISLSDDANADGDNLLASHFRKSESWRYEQEYRLLTWPKYCHQDPKTGHEFLHVELSWIRRIDFGLKCPKSTVTKLRDWANQQPTEIQLFTASIHPTKYELCYEPLP
jgi:hypothetical protein